MVRTLTITDEVYTALARRKKHPRDSFSKVILRLVRQPPDPLAFAGAWADRAPTAVTAYELALGATTAVRRRAALGLLETLEVLPLDSHVAWVAGEVMRDLKSEGREAPFRDLLIAVVARERGWALHTFDRGVPDIPGLDLRREA